MPFSRTLLFCAVLAGLFLSACSLQKKKLGNVYRGVLISKIKGFDPADVSDLYSHICQKQVFEALYQYKYLARPFDIEPCLAESLPSISEDGLLWRIRLKKGIRFTDDPCFPGGKGREITARDFIHGIKRLADVRTRSTGWWLFEGKVEGLDAFRESTAALNKGAKADYFSDIAGLTAPDDYTVQIRLTRPCPYFKYILTMGYTAFFPREAVAYYGEEFLNHPVGTGPYVLKEWRRSLRLVFERNPSYRHGFYPSEGEERDRAAGLLEDAGKALPLIDRLELYIFTESQPMILNFLRGNLEQSGIPKDDYNNIVLPNKSLKEEYGEKGIELNRYEDLDLTYTVFNFADTLLARHKKLRQAISLAEDVEKTIELFYNGRAIMAQSPIPPGMFGYEAAFRNPYRRYDPEKARQLLAEEGFPGGRGLPELEYLTMSETTSRQMAEKFVMEMAAIGIKARIEAVTWPEFLKRIKERKCQIAGLAWVADYPDPENFLQLLYGPNEAPGENTANYRNAEYDSLYRLISVMPDGPERLDHIRRMKGIVAEDCPWIFNTHRTGEGLSYQWLGNSKPLIVSPGNFKYLKVDVDQRNKMLGRR